MEGSLSDSVAPPGTFTKDLHSLLDIKILSKNLTDQKCPGQSRIERSNSLKELCLTESNACNWNKGNKG